MIISVVREYKWPPRLVGGLFIDREDYLGLMFWYDDIVDVTKQLKTKK